MSVIVTNPQTPRNSEVKVGSISDEHHVGDVVTVINSRFSRELVEAKEANDATPIRSRDNAFPNRVGDMEVKAF